MYDNLGGEHTINIYFTDTGSNLGGRRLRCVDGIRRRRLSLFSGPLATQTLTFNPTTGALSSRSPLSFAVPNGQTINFDLSTMTQLAAGFDVTAATRTVTRQGISGISISTTGSLTFNYANGRPAPPTTFRSPMS